MPHAAFYVVQLDGTVFDSKQECFNAARSILCGATFRRGHVFAYELFQCRTQHFMWCNHKLQWQPSVLIGFNAARSILCGATGHEQVPYVSHQRFNAARSILCGATSRFV